MDENTPLKEVKAYLREHVEEGVDCPACTQHVKLYKRKVNSGMAVSLIKLYRAAGLGWQHIATTLENRHADEAKLRYWGLMEEGDERREDGGRAGWWRVTEKGRDFVLGHITVPKYARVFDARLFRLEGEEVGIREALGDKFDYNELMGIDQPLHATCPQCGENMTEVRKVWGVVVGRCRVHGEQQRR